MSTDHLLVVWRTPPELPSSVLKTEQFARALSCYGDVVFFREQALCSCGRTLSEHRAGPFRRLIRLFTGRTGVCTVSRCRGFEPASFKW